MTDERDRCAAARTERAAATYTGRQILAGVDAVCAAGGVRAAVGISSRSWRIWMRTSIKFPWPGLHNRDSADAAGGARPVAVCARSTSSTWLSASGTSCMVASVLSASVLRHELRAFGGVLARWRSKLVKPTVTVAAMLAMAYLMNYSGATGRWAWLRRDRPAVSVLQRRLMGWLGVFLTGSDTSSNALFGNLQVVSASRLGLDPVLIAGGELGGRSDGQDDQPADDCSGRGGDGHVRQRTRRSCSGLRCGTASFWLRWSGWR